jgi:hypothetical protein
VTVAPPPVALLDLVKFLPLFVGKINGHLPVPLVDDLLDTPASVVPHFLKLRSRFIDNWRNFGDLFGCQTKFRTKSLLHSGADQPWMVNIKEKMPSVKSPQSSASDSASDEYKNKSGNKFPL